MNENDRVRIKVTFTDYYYVERRYLPDHYDLPRSATAEQVAAVDQRVAEGEVAAFLADEYLSGEATVTFEPA